MREMSFSRAIVKIANDAHKALAQSRPSGTQSAGVVEPPTMYLCPVGCGCAWRDNLNGTMSLYDANQKSCGVCETLPLKDLVPVPTAPGNIERHLYVDQRDDGLWLVCVQSQYDTRAEAQAACRSWMAHYKTTDATPPATSGPVNQDGLVGASNHRNKDVKRVLQPCPARGSGAGC